MEDPLEGVRRKIRNDTKSTAPFSQFVASVRRSLVSSRCVRRVWHGEACWAFKTDLDLYQTFVKDSYLQEGVEI